MRQREEGRYKINPSRNFHLCLKPRKGATADISINYEKIAIAALNEN